MKKNREIICGLTAWVLTVCFFLSCLLIPGLSKRISEHGNINILVYGMTLVLFCILFLAGMAWSTSRQNNSLKLTESPVAKKTALVILLGSQLPFWIMCVTRETEQVGTVSMKYGWHTQPLAVMILLFLAELAVFFWLYENLSLTEKKGEWIIWLTYAALVVLIFYCMYTPNIYGRGEQGDNYHAHAYFNSVYNVYQGVPYTHNVTSIYGHYGLFFKIPMKLVHGDFRAFVLMMAGLGALTYIGAFLVLQMLVRSRILRVIAAFALAFPVLGMRGGYYWQVLCQLAQHALRRKIPQQLGAAADSRRRLRFDGEAEHGRKAQRTQNAQPVLTKAALGLTHAAYDAVREILRPAADIHESRARIISERIHRKIAPQQIGAQAARKRHAVRPPVI